MQLQDEYLKEVLPFYQNLAEAEKEFLKSKMQYKQLKKGEVIYHADSIWKGLKLVTKGQIRLFVCSEQGDGVTLYRIRENEMCIISMVCLLEQNLKTSMGVDAEQDTEIYNIPGEVYFQLMQQNESVRKITDEISRQRFGEIMSVISDLVFSNVEQRLCRALLEHAGYAADGELAITHETLARDIGSAREVVTRNLKRLQNLGYVEVTRGKIIILKEAALREIVEKS